MPSHGVGGAQPDRAQQRELPGPAFAPVKAGPDLQEQQAGYRRQRGRGGAGWDGHDRRQVMQAFSLTRCERSSETKPTDAVITASVPAI